MSLIITGKGDFSLLQNFKSGDFSAYELYLNTYDESFVDQQINLLPDHINITSIHNPTQIIIDGKRTLFDLADPGKIGEESLNVLQKTISLGKKLGSKIIVIHGATYNHYNQTKNEALELLASRVKPLLGGEISLSFETDMLWHHLFYTKRPVLATLEDFNKLDHLIDGYLKITADIEHLNLTFIFLKFVEYFGGEKAFFQRYSEFNRFAFEKDIIFYIKNNSESLSLQFNEYLASFFSIMNDKINHIHINGSDCHNPIFNSNTDLPFVGEHLPLGFDEDGCTDRLDYHYIAKVLCSLPNEKKINVVLEIWTENKNQFPEESRKSKFFLNKYLINNKNNDGNKMEDNKMVNMPIRIGDKEIKDFTEPFIIADIGSNHLGDLELVKQLVDKAVECGCDSVKFQAWSKKSLFSKQIYQDNESLEKQIDQFTFELEKYGEFKNYCDQKGILFSASVFCKEEVDYFADKLNVPYLKIASMDINNHPFLEYAAKKRIPLILSTGFADLSEIDEAVRLISKYNKNLILLHCTGLYPQKDEQSHLNNIDLLRKNFGLSVGYSDHSVGITIPLATAVKGACIIEKHFSLDNQDEKIWDKDFSADPLEMKTLVIESKRLTKALGNDKIILDEDSFNQRKNMRRSIVAKNDLFAGSVLKEEDLDAKRPGTGIGPKYTNFIIGRTLKKSLKADDLIKFEDLV